MMCSVRLSRRTRRFLFRRRATTPMISAQIFSWPSLVSPLVSKNSIAGVVAAEYSSSTEGKGSTFLMRVALGAFSKDLLRDRRCGQATDNRLKYFSGPPLALNDRWYPETRAGRGFRDAGGGT